MEMHNWAEASAGGELGDGPGTADDAPTGVGIDEEDGRLPAFLTPREAAERLRVSVWAVYDAVKAETLPAVRVGRAIRIPRRAVIVEARAVRHQAEA